MSDNPERFRIYRRWPNGELRCVATAASLLDASYALAILAGEGELTDCTTGILDRPDPEEVGTWIVNPFPPAG